MTSPLDEQQQVVLRKRHTCFVEGKIVPNEKSAKILSPDSLFHSATRQDTPDYVIANLDRPIFLGGHAPNIFDFPCFPWSEFETWTFFAIGLRMPTRHSSISPINNGNLIRKVNCQFEHSSYSPLQRFFSNLVQFLLVPAVFLPTMLTLFWLLHPYARFSCML